MALVLQALFAAEVASQIQAVVAVLQVPFAEQMAFQVQAAEKAVLEALPAAKMALWDLLAVQAAAMVVSQVPAAVMTVLWEVVLGMSF